MTFLKNETYPHTFTSGDYPRGRETGYTLDSREHKDSPFLMTSTAIIDRKSPVIYILNKRSTLIRCQCEMNI